MRFFLASIFAASLTLSAAGGASSTNELPFASWSIPAAVTSRPDPSSSNGQRIPKLGFKIREGSNQWDATEFLSTLGVTFPPGSETVYSLEFGELIVRNTRENLDLIDRVLVDSGIANAPCNVMLELSIYECRLPTAKHPTAQTTPTIPDLRKLPPENIKRLDQVSTSTSSGQRISMAHLQKSAPNSEQKPEPEAEKETDLPPRFRAGEYGLVAEWEPTVGPDGTVIDSSVGFRWRAGASAKDFPEITLNTHFSSWDGYPRILHISSCPDDPEKYFVTTGLAQVTASRDFTLEDLKAAAAKFQTSQKESANP